jgi:hypothetical protein
MTKKPTKKEFIQYLNKSVGYNWKATGKYKATKRMYGDYIYSADKDMFDMQYKEYLKQVWEK